MRQICYSHGLIIPRCLLSVLLHTCYTTRVVLACCTVRASTVVNGAQSSGAVTQGQSNGCARAGWVRLPGPAARLPLCRVPPAPAVVTGVLRHARRRYHGRGEPGAEVTHERIVRRAAGISPPAPSGVPAPGQRRRVSPWRSLPTGIAS